MTRIAIIDTETTGLDPSIHEIIDLACILVDSRDLSVIDTYESKAKPLSIETAHPKALEVNGYNEEEWVDAPSIHTVMGDLARLTDHATLLAYNVSFDHGFLKASFDRTGVKDTMNYQRLDLLTLAWFQLPHFELGSWKLKSVAQHLGIPPEPDMHRALNGARCAYEVLKKLREVPVHDPA